MTITIISIHHNIHLLILHIFNINETQFSYLYINEIEL